MPSCDRLYVFREVENGRRVEWWERFEPVKPPTKVTKPRGPGRLLRVMDPLAAEMMAKQTTRRVLWERYEPEEKAMAAVAGD